MSKRTTFNDTAIQSEFEENGYVIIDFLKPEDLTDLTKYYHEVIDKMVPEGYYATTCLPELDKIKEINLLIEKTFQESIKRVFNNYNILVSAFLVKKNLHSELHWHQDWAFVDENKYVSVNIWCPLVQTDFYNGGLCVIPKSHKLPKQFRSAPEYSNGYPDYENLFQGHQKNIATSLGQAVVFDHSLLHYSPPNQSGTVRVVAASNLVPAEAKTFLYANEIESANKATYKVSADKEFFLNYDFASNPISLGRPKELVSNAPAINFESELKKLYPIEHTSPETEIVIAQQTKISLLRFLLNKIGM